MKKKLLSVVFVLFMLCAFMPVIANAASSGTCGQYGNANLKWVLDDNGTLTISGEGNMKDYTSTDVPPWSDYKGSIETIVLENGVSTIGSRAFSGCSKLTNVSISDSIDSIGEYAFSSCSTLKSVNIPISVTIIGKYAFNYCTSLTDITIGNSVKTIYEDAFANCSSLTEITIPDSVTYIGGSAFYNCNHLREISLPFVGSSRTAKNTYNSVLGYIFGIGASYSSGTTFQYYNSQKKGEYYFIPSTLKKVTITSAEQIPYGAFDGCHKLTSISISDSVSSISQYAFDCSSLEEITLPFVGASRRAKGVEGLFGYIFPFSYPNDGYTVSDAVQYYDTSNYIRSHIPSTLKKVTITNAEQIPYGAFSGCYSLTDISILDGVKTIDKTAFKKCSGLTSIILPNSVTSIGYEAFNGCNNLGEMTLPFVGSSRDAKNTYDAVLGYIFGYTNDSSVSGTTLQKWKVGSDYYYSDYYYIPSSLKKVTITDAKLISYGAFYNCSNLSEISIADGVLEFGEEAFYNTGYYNNASNWDDEILYLGNCLIEAKKDITSVTIKPETKSVLPNAFSGCNNLSDVYITDLAAWCNIIFGNTASNPLWYANNLYINGNLTTEITIPDSITKIPNYTFCGYSSLTNVTIPHTVTSIGDAAFRNCRGITNVYYNGSYIDLTKISIGVDNENLTNSTIHCDDFEAPTWGKCGDTVAWFLDDEGTLTISGAGSMYNYYGYNTYGNPRSPWGSLTGITKVVIEQGVTRIGSYAFDGCSGLMNITIPDSITSISCC